MREIDEIVENFEFFDDWEGRYQYLIELGEALPAMPDELKREENWVKPCMSTVHVSAHLEPSDPSLIYFRGDCDTAIIKGVLALLLDLFSHRTLDEIRGLDVDSLFRRLKLEEHLSPSRHVGIYAIVEKMIERAEALSKAETSKLEPTISS
ncbi:MAG: SufE family protein [Candidatus Thiodiazotropha sp.]|nr:MAG: Fe-S metabolism protein SufE [gamma proteobacterium symbiont of Ctena orbiculata]